MEAESSEAMSKLTGGLGEHWARFPLLMDYYSSQITKLIEELSKLPGLGPSRPSAWHSISSTCRRSRWRSWQVP